MLEQNIQSKNPFLYHNFFYQFVLGNHKINRGLVNFGTSIWVILNFGWSQLYQYKSIILSQNYCKIILGHKNHFHLCPCMKLIYCNLIVKDIVPTIISLCAICWKIHSGHQKAISFKMSVKPSRLTHYFQDVTYSTCNHKLEDG